MPMFRYRAEDAAGKPCRGVQEAQSARHARQLLRERGLSIQSMRVASGVGIGRLLKNDGLNAAERALVTRQLATLLQAAMPLAEALRAVAAQSEKRRVQHLILAVGERVSEGYGLAQALLSYPQAFPPVYCATVAAAERSGHLAQVFERLADHTENQQVVRQRVQLALVYPLILLFASLLIVAFLLGYVVPDVVQVFVHGQQELPAMTRVLMALSEGTRRYGLSVVALVAGSLVLARWALREPSRRARWHSLLLNMPLCGALVRSIEAARFIGTLAILGKSGVPLADAMHIAAAVVGNLAVRQRLAEAARAVSEGTTLASSLEHSQTLPPLMLHMIASAERAGELDGMLERAADLQEKLLAGRITLAVSLFEPLMLVLMGAVVLFIVLAILMPILNLNQLVN
ncbi:type II secretion system inner membrane protein GspF [Pseudomonas akapageensis]|uniref:type II secretion system inner membrane protein GspF n=1 Tax=Pseudomonas akapageensis TaxID=2609961 RepID=UPI0014097DFF|nr:type II secretion system inner membrane protein GspF [Pseudomonas akapageensis]